ncbi:restriction endonuclease [Myxococcota bacterium]|nr:restriction endonuclease [Myxococcota bacterium]
MPTFDKLMNPMLDALFSMGGSASVDEIYEKVLELEKIPESVSSVPHDPEKSNQTEVGYRLAWARSYLKKYGVLENSTRGVWTVTPKGKRMHHVDTKEVLREIRGGFVPGPKSLESEVPQTIETECESPIIPSWQQELHQLLIKELSPDAFERLAQRLLRESGFIQVEVTGRTGDGGIDGKGIARIHGFMSFHVFFQCKRYKGSVSASEMRDFRGAMVGRADKGLFITTGTFSPAATREATRDGAPPIDMVDGEELARKLKELGLGVKTEMIEQVSVDPAWFQGL